MKHIIILILFLESFTLPLMAQQDSVMNLQQQLPADDTWWQLFGDSTLTALIQKAMDNNYDLRNAVKNIELAKSRLRISKSAYYPEISASASYSPEKSSLGIDHTELYSRVGQAGLSMSWEIDVFGNIRNNVKSQKQYYLASQEDYRG